MVNFLKFSFNEKLLKSVVTPLSSAHAYKTERRGRVLRRGTLQKLHKAKKHVTGYPQ